MWVSLFPEFRKHGSPPEERDNALVSNLRSANTEDGTTCLFTSAADECLMSVEMNRRNG